MEMIQTHECINRTAKLATEDAPFHFTDSGLPNVYLVGIRYYTCDCGSVVAEIPAARQLMQLIARDLVEEPDSLTGAEIRFLRKRLGKKATDFAREIGIDPATLSRIENGKQESSEQLDKLVRLVYTLSANDLLLLEQVKRKLDTLLTAWTPQRQPESRIVKRIDHSEWIDGIAA